MALTPRLMAWNTLPKSVLSTRRAKANCRPRPQARMRSLMARLREEISQAAANKIRRPSNPVKRPILPHDFQDQLALIGLLRGDAESIFHHFGGFFHPVFAGVIDAAEH